MDGKWASRLPDALAGMAQEYIKGVLIWPCALEQLFLG